MLKGLFILDPGAHELIYGEALHAEIARRVELVAGVQTRDAVAKNPGLLADVEVIFSGWGAPIMNEEFLAAAPKLRAVFYGAGSIKSMTPKPFWDRGIVVTS